MKIREQLKALLLIYMLFDLFIIALLSVVIDISNKGYIIILASTFIIFLIKEYKLIKKYLVKK